MLNSFSDQTNVPSICSVQQEPPKVTKGNVVYIRCTQSDILSDRLSTMSHYVAKVKNVQRSESIQETEQKKSNASLGLAGAH